MTAIIFGANGQDGFYLSQLLQSKNIKVIGVSRKGNFLKLDISDYNQVADLITKEQPAYIFHLAANSTTWHGAIFENHATISTGALNILEAVKNTSPATKIFISGSGLQFANSNKPIKESDAFEARDAYSVSRIQSVHASRYFRSLGLEVYVGYFFNHDSPRRSERHMAQKIAAFAKRVGNGSIEKLEIGDILVKKEWGFAGDIVKAVWALVNQNDIFEAILGTGEAYSIEEWLQACFSIIGKNWRDYIIESKNFKAEYNTLVSNPALIKSLGWQPETSFHELAKMMVGN